MCPKKYVFITSPDAYANYNPKKTVNLHKEPELLTVSAHTLSTFLYAKKTGFDKQVKIEYWKGSLTQIHLY